MSAKVAPGMVVRSATQADLPRLLASADLVFRHPTRPGLGSMGHDYPLLFHPDNAPNLSLVEAPGGEIIAHAGFVLRPAEILGQRLQVACFGSVFTLPEHRNHGLATAVLGAAVERAQRLGTDLGLVSGARGLYERAGFSPFPPCVRYRIRRTQDASDQGSDGLVAYSEAALAELMDIQAQEPVRFVRSADDWRRVMGTGVVFFEPGEVFLVKTGNTPVAYVAVGHPEPDGSGPSRARILEIGGSRAAIAGAARPLLSRLGVDELEILLGSHDQSLDPFAAQLGWQRERVWMPFTCAFFNPRFEGLPPPFFGLNYV